MTTEENRPTYSGAASLQIESVHLPQQDNSIHTTATELHAAGITPIPVRDDGTKAPAIPRWQKHETTREDIDAWFGGEHPRHGALGVVTGPASGNLEMTEIEGAYTHHIPTLAQLATDSGLADLWAKLNAGWLEQSPSGGIHWFYRVDGDPVPGNTKLAETLGRDTIAETRGTGGQVVVAPTPGTAHESGNPWVTLRGGTIPTITEEEREGFHTLLATLDERPHAPEPEPTIFDRAAAEERDRLRDLGGATPGDDYEAKTDWVDILTPHGWTHLFNRGQTSYWTRPGKQTGISATTGHAQDRDRLYVFSSNTPFPTQEPITKFSAYALLNHGGDHSEAARQLRRDGYGEQAPPPPIATATTAGSSDPTAVVLDDSPLAELTAEALRSTYRWAGQAGWYRYTGHVWEQSTEATIIEAVRRHFIKLHAKWIKGADAERARRLTTLYTANKIRNVASLLRGQLEIDVLQFDQHHHLLNTLNGTVDLRTGVLSPHDPEHYLTKITGAEYHPDRTHPDWNTALEALPNDAVDWFQFRVGQAATGHPPPDDKMLFPQGPGSNGKSAILNAIIAAAGGYAGIIPEKVLLANPNEHSTELTSLIGVRIAVIEELPDNGRINAKRLKDAVGTPIMTARRIRENPITWEATHTLFVSTNPKPRFPDTDWAVWRRLVMLTFPYKYMPPGTALTSPEQRHGDPGLRDRLRDNKTVREAVLAWIVAGATRWYAANKVMPPEPASVVQATNEWRDGSDHLGAWFRERIEIEPSYAVMSTELFEDFSDWLRSHGHTPWSDQTFTERLRAHPVLDGHEVKKHRPRSVPYLSRRFATMTTAPARPTVWTGVRFAT